MVDTRTTEEYERWFARQRLVPLTDPDIPVPRRQEDFPLTGEEDEGSDEDEGDDDYEPDSVDQESLQDIPIEPETARIEEMEMCRATIASQYDHIATVERHNAILRTEHDQFRAEIARLTAARDTTIAQA